MGNLMKLDEKSHNYKFMLIFSFLQLTLFFVVTRVFAGIEENINCVYYPCFDIFITNYLSLALPYFIAWILVMGLTMVVSYYGIISLPWFRKKVNSSQN